MSVNLIDIIGIASGKNNTVRIYPSDHNKTMLDFLTQKKLPIASSCSGRAICRKCITQDGLLLCQYKVSEYISKFGDQVMIDYL